MKIEIWSDYACPFCYIGKRHLEVALSQFAHAENVEIVHKAFELDPTASNEVTTTTQQRIKRKYGRTPANARAFIRHVEATAQKAGLEMKYETVQNTNTFDAHRLTKLAESLGKADVMNERLMYAYFTENLALAERKNLVKCGEDVGINRELIEKLLDSDQFANEARQDEQEARQIGIQGVPFLVIDGKFGLSGAQPADYMLQALNQAWNEQAESEITAGIACGIDGCN
ncbi:DsbA family oxidoreductase [Actinobacillus equuli subsp. haemolyticus]|uniref:DSBA oxidoreductase n=1 Tax=Actinobacillus equuli TaxID=718 RepID=A0AAX3FI41_ACTEU|nr:MULTISPECIES: DsbA family oxidoreductase [Actinobacillus]AIZ79742.1 DSBA oxidoreductase [Actinobacillus equuli subsp. equuli]WGE33127.1 DsbA family oxidoreductase [Actinobacillus genomosp. 1]WGE43851.1 DsbA family oxidoreductase [Actinobacillus equuli subsp. equuli]WGE66823.1 DsbA family oxidoreductase [Actinobacillus equuli subsp. haemolyticus]WGE71946.1 DsbA family oxidoreductase [Actinobacillus equuli subsp. haemolyticus]